MVDKEKERDWDREMAQVDKLLAKLPNADPTLGRPVPGKPNPQAGVPTVRNAPLADGDVGARSRVTTWIRVFLGLALGIGMLVWPYTHGCGLKLVFYLIGATTVTVAGVWSALSSWRRRLGWAHVLSIGVTIWGLVLAAREILPRTVYEQPNAHFFCPEP
jgi:hypothetical protein